jgi:hypothetical protein
MNAYELAYKLNNALGVDYEMLEQSSIMLRQQADRIAELEKGEEVAGRFYWESVVDGHVMAVPSEGTPHYNKDDFPLYTTPQIKELSDEEIKKCVIAWVKQIYGNEYVTPSDRHIINGTKLIRLAEKRIFKNDSL